MKALESVYARLDAQANETGKTAPEMTLPAAEFDEVLAEAEAQNYNLGHPLRGAAESISLYTVHGHLLLRRGGP